MIGNCATGGVDYTRIRGNAARAGTILRVIPIPAAKAKSVGDDVRAAAAAFNVRLFAQGEIQTDQEATMVSVRLVNGVTGEQAWSESASLDKAATLDQRWLLLHALVWHLAQSLISAELRRVAARSPEQATPLDYVLRAHVVNRTESDGLKSARERERLLEEALQRDPNLVAALVGLAAVLIDRIDYDCQVDRDRLVRRIDDLTGRAVRLNDSQPTTWVFRSKALMYMGQWSASLEASSRGMRAEPYSSELVVGHANLMIMCGRPSDALVLVEQATAMDPQVEAAAVAGEAHLLLGHYREAVVLFQRAIGLYGDNFLLGLLLASAYANAGDVPSAVGAKEQVLRGIPGYSIVFHRSRGYSANPEYMRLVEEHLYVGMRKAGFSEG